MTHGAIDRRLCGHPLERSAGRARVALETVAEMAADDRGLVHGGFVFGCADYAAMLAIGEAFVVLAAAEVRFLAPVVVGERLVAEAVEGEPAGRTRRVEVVVHRDDDRVFEGRFDCAVPPCHVLDRGRSGGER